VTHRVILSPAAARELRKLDRGAATRVVRTLEVLADQPRPPAATPLVGRAGVWRVRTGDYRLLYEIHDDELLVLVIRVSHRRDVYGR
jgi:mRNA interferase RelE/StbE